jgi:murein DD-endopeptidase MepM/ murein hydrolase activator NlpD
MNKLGRFARSPRLFSGITWGVTFLVVAILLGYTVWRLFPASGASASAALPTLGAPAYVPLPNQVGSVTDPLAIVRKVALVTFSDKNVRYNVVKYTAKTGDTVSSIAESYGLKASSLLWSNATLMRNGPNSLKVGQVLQIPPVDGVLYQWEAGDTLESVAEKFGVTSDDILLWPGNNLELPNPEIPTDTLVMVPGGKSDAIQWVSVSYASGASGTSSGYASTCGPSDFKGGGGTLMWPSPYHYINGGNNFSSSHLGIDIYAPEGTQITAADNGTVVWASWGGAWNGGYGNVVMIDHNNGFKTLYGHLSQVNVVMCENVYAGELIGLSGNTGNSFGAHLHFEVRLGGGFMNPWDYLPPQ